MRKGGAMGPAYTYIYWPLPVQSPEPGLTGGPQALRRLQSAASTATRSAARRKRGVRRTTPPASSRRKVPPAGCPSTPERRSRASPPGRGTSRRSTTNRGTRPARVDSRSPVRPSRAQIRAAAKIPSRYQGRAA